MAERVPDVARAISMGQQFTFSCSCSRGMGTEAREPGNGEGGGDNSKSKSKSKSNNNGGTATIKSGNYGNSTIIPPFNQERVKAELARWASPILRMSTRRTHRCGAASLKSTFRSTWTRPRMPSGVTVLGDVTHVITPFAGVGVNVGMMDTPELGEGIAAFVEEAGKKKKPLG
ncbi:hypothetical protein MGN70_002404 [Eutypa lata]|nr:hypothetical protein MGN70_002404 [Eutypa lata]